MWKNKPTASHLTFTIGIDWKGYDYIDFYFYSSFWCEMAAYKLLYSMPVFKQQKFIKNQLQLYWHTFYFSSLHRKKNGWIQFMLQDTKQWHQIQYNQTYFQVTHDYSR